MRRMVGTETHQTIDQKCHHQLIITITLYCYPSHSVAPAAAALMEMTACRGNEIRECNYTEIPSLPSSIISDRFLFQRQVYSQRFPPLVYTSSFYASSLRVLWSKTFKQDGNETRSSIYLYIHFYLQYSTYILHISTSTFKQ